jgi:hypothetical protein
MKEKLRMQFLAGLITESEYKQLLEYSKSQREFILLKLNSPKSSDTDALLNALNQQGVTYPDIKKQIEDKKITDLEDLKKLKSQSKSDLRKQSKSNVVILLDNEDFLIIQPKTYEANCYYGAGTQWCTTSKTDGRERFDYYTKVLPITFIIDKSKPSTDSLYKVGLSYESYYQKDSNGGIKWKYELMAWDANDKGIDERKYLEYLKNKGVDISKFKLVVE